MDISSEMDVLYEKMLNMEKEIEKLKEKIVELEKENRKSLIDQMASEIPQEPYEVLTLKKISFDSKVRV